MGSCVSLHHKEHESAMKLGLSVNENNNNKVVIASPVKPSSDTVNPAAVAAAAADGDFKPNNTLSRGVPGSKEEAFFDSQPWMDSDCEDDFYSVNGDFTPSRGNTPVHHKFSAGNLQLQVTKPTITEESQETADAAALPSPPEKKKRLSELFKESLRHGGEEENTAGNGTAYPAKDEAKPIPYSSVANSNEVIPNGASKDSKSFKSQCCLPGLRSSRSFNERRNNMTNSPVHSVG